MSITIVKQGPESRETENLKRLFDACARMVPLCPISTEFQGARVQFDFRVIDGRLQIQNMSLDVGKPVGIIIQ